MKKIKMLASLLLSVMLVTLAFTACSSGDQPEETSATTTTATTTTQDGITFDRTNVVISIGDNVQLTVTLLSTGAETSNVLWLSNDPSIASVSANGTITGVSDGTTTIKASTIDGKYTATCTVQVSSTVTEVTLEPENLELSVGSTYQLTANVLPASVKTELQWQSSVPSVATVSEDGVVTALQSGTTSIIVTTADGGFTDACIVSVVIPVQTVTLSDIQLDLNKGVSHHISYSILPSDATNKSLSWSTSDPTVAVVDQDGNVTAVGRGNAVITAVSHNNIAATCNVVVTSSVNGVSLDKTDVTLEIGSVAKLTAAIDPVDANNQKVTWTTSDPSIVTVTQSGEITAVSGGIAIITVTTADGGFTAECTVNVANPALTITFENYDITMDTGANYTLNPILSYESPEETFSWASSDKNIVSVNKNGVLTAKEVGTATITVTSSSGATASVNVTVNQAIVDIPVSSVVIDEMVTVTEGDEVVLNITFLPSNATDTSYTYKVTTENIKIKDGKIIAIKEGYATVTVVASNGVRSGACVVKVEALDQETKTAVIEEYHNEVDAEDLIYTSNVSTIESKYASDIASYESQISAAGLTQTGYEEQLNAYTAALAIMQASYDSAVASGDTEAANNYKAEIDQLNASIDSLNAAWAVVQALQDKLDSITSAKSAELATENTRHENALDSIDDKYEYILRYVG